MAICDGTVEMRCGVGDMFVFLVRDCLRENLSYVGRKWSGEGWREGRGGERGDVWRDGEPGGRALGGEGWRKGKSEARERKNKTRVGCW